MNKKSIAAVVSSLLGLIIAQSAMAEDAFNAWGQRFNSGTQLEPSELFSAWRQGGCIDTRVKNHENSAFLVSVLHNPGSMFPLASMLDTPTTIPLGYTITSATAASWIKILNDNLRATAYYRDDHGGLAFEFVSTHFSDFRDQRVEYRREPNGSIIAKLSCPRHAGDLEGCWYYDRIVKFGQAFRYCEFPAGQFVTISDAPAQ